MHLDSLTGRSQRRTTGQQLPEPRLLIDTFLLGRHTQHLKSEGCCDDRLNSPSATVDGTCQEPAFRNMKSRSGSRPIVGSGGGSVSWVATMSSGLMCSSSFRKRADDAAFFLVRSPRCLNHYRHVTENVRRAQPR